MEPKIRLNGFTGKWKEVLINKIGASYSGLSNKTKDDFGQGDAKFITFLNVLTNAKVNTSILEPVNVRKGEKQNEVKKGDLLFNTSSETPEEVGMCAVMGEEIKNVYLNSFCFGFRITDKNISPMCIAHLMRSQVGRIIMSILAQGATRYNLSKSNFCKTVIRLPKDLKEQEFIASYFEHLDSLILSTTKKIESLKQVKAASLQSMFPQKGETTPRVRFKGFEGEWKEDMANNLCKIGTGKSNTQDQAEEGKYPFYIRSEKVMRSNKYIYDCEAVITIGDGNIGRVFHYVNGKFDLHQRCYKMTEFQKVLGIYFFYYFSSSFYDRAIKMSAKATVDSVRLDMIANMPVLYPESIEEQQAIADYFTNLDSLIISQTQHLDKLKQIKSACLDNMFV